MSIIVVEIDTRNGPEKTVFECSNASNQSEEVKQFWKTLILPPPIESSLYSKEILQKAKIHPLKEVSIDNSAKTMQVDPKTEAFVENLKILNQIDEINKIQTKIAKIEDIRSLKKRQKRRFYNISTNSAPYMTKSETEMRNNDLLMNYDGEDNNRDIDKIGDDDDDYDNLNTDLEDREMLKNIDNDDYDSDH